MQDQPTLDTPHVHEVNTREYLELLLSRRDLRRITEITGGYEYLVDGRTGERFHCSGNPSGEPAPGQRTA